MMKNLLLILLLCMGIKAPAQQYFNVRNPLHSFTSILTSVIPYNDKYYCTGPCIDSVNYVGSGQALLISGIKFAVFDQYGNKLQDTVYQENYKNFDPWSNNLQIMSNNSLLLASEEFDTGGVQKVLLVRFDTTGKMLWKKSFDKNFCTSFNDYWIKIVDMKPAENGNLLLLSRISCRASANALQLDMKLTKLDAGFNIIWEKQYGVSNMDDGGWKLLVEPDGYLIAGGRNNISQVQKNFTLRALLMKTDTAGNVQWEWLSDPAKKTFEAKDVIRTQDGGYVYCGQGSGVEHLSADGSYGTLYFRGWVEKLDSNRNVLWNHTYNRYLGQTEFKKIIEAPNGNLYLFGNKYLPDSIGPNNWEPHTRGWFMTLSPNGDSLRERIYSNVNSCDDKNLFYDAQQTDDGGFVMCGESQDNCYPYTPPTQRGWLVKVDSNGCLGPGDPQCWPTSVPQITALPGITVHPNPVHDQWWVTNPAAQPIDISILDLTGRVLIKTSSAAAEVPLNLGHLAPAIYLYRIQNKQGALLQGKILKE